MTRPRTSPSSLKDVAQESEGATRGDGTGNDDRPHPLAYWFDVTASILMSVAIVATAYSAWQANRWNGVEATSFAEASSARISADTFEDEAATNRSYDAITFGEFALKYGPSALEDPDVMEEATFYADLLMRDEFRVALDAWIALEPLNNPDAPSTPFVMDEYQNADLDGARRLQAVAEEKLEVGRDANQNSDNYLLSTVIFASVLFFAGVAPKFRVLSAQGLVIAFALIGLAVGFWWLTTLPVH